MFKAADFNNIDLVSLFFEGVGNKMSDNSELDPAKSEFSLFVDLRICTRNGF